MTKMKSKKMTKSTFAIIIMAVAMVAMLAFGGTYAYFTAEANAKTGQFKTGQVSIVAGDVTTVGISEPIASGELILESPIKITNKSTVDTYLFVKLEVTGLTLQKSDATLNDGQAKITLIKDDSRTWTELEAGVYYIEVTDGAEAGTETIFAKNMKFEANSKTTNGGASSGDIMNKVMTITISTAAIQSTKSVAEDGTVTKFTPQEAYAAVTFLGTAA